MVFLIVFFLLFLIGVVLTIVFSPRRRHNVNLHASRMLLTSSGIVGLVIWSCLVFVFNWGTSKSKLDDKYNAMIYALENKSDDTDIDSLIVDVINYNYIKHININLIVKKMKNNSDNN